MQICGRSQSGGGWICLEEVHLLSPRRELTKRLGCLFPRCTSNMRPPTTTPTIRGLRSFLAWSNFNFGVGIFLPIFGLGKSGAPEHVHVCLKSNTRRRRHTVLCFESRTPSDPSLCPNQPSVALPSAGKYTDWEKLLAEPAKQPNSWFLKDVQTWASVHSKFQCFVVAKCLPPTNLRRKTQSLVTDARATHRPAATSLHAAFATRERLPPVFAPGSADIWRLISFLCPATASATKSSELPGAIDSIDLLRSHNRLSKESACCALDD